MPDSQDFHQTTIQIVVFNLKEKFYAISQDPFFPKALTREDFLAFLVQNTRLLKSQAKANYFLKSSFFFAKNANPLIKNLRDKNSEKGLHF